MHTRWEVGPHRLRTRTSFHPTPSLSQRQFPVSKLINGKRLRKSLSNTRGSITPPLLVHSADATAANSPARLPTPVRLPPPGPPSHVCRRDQGRDQRPYRLQVRRGEHPLPSMSHLHPVCLCAGIAEHHRFRSVLAGWLTDLCSAVVGLGYGGSVLLAAAGDVEVQEHTQGHGR